MNGSKLKIFSVVKFADGYETEICKDIIWQYENKVANCFLFVFSLNPEGNPPINKAEILCQKFEKYKEMLKGIPLGILVQSSIGHGYVLGEEPDFEKLTVARSGEKNGTVCPLDKGFKEYIKMAFERMAKSEPCHIMLDDDYRILRRGTGGGCACPLHLERFSQICGKKYSREELMNIIESKSREGKELEKKWVLLQKESMLETAKIMRDAIDSVNPQIEGSFCCCGNDAEFAAEISEILAGNGEKIVRLNNANYCSNGTRGFSRVFLRTAHQVAKLKGKVDCMIAETDTCPHNRYSTSAVMLHAQIVGSIIEGLNGAMHWITRSAHEMESGKAYRNVLSKYSGFYDTLAQITPTVKWRGFRIPMEDTPNHCVMHPFEKENEDDAWSTLLLERLGLPMYFSAQNGGVLCLEGKKDEFLSDEQILESLKGTVFITSDAVERLCKRGFGEYIGVSADEWHGKTPVGELVLFNNQILDLQSNLKQLVLNNQNVRVESYVCNTVDRQNYEKLFPAVTVYENSLGGKVVAFAGSPKAPFNYENFSFLNETRKTQFVKFLEEMTDGLIYCDGDNEVYFRAGVMPGGRTFCALFNFGLDVMDEVVLVSKNKINCISKLMANGDFEKVPFVKQGEKYIIQTKADVLSPLIFVIS